MKKDNSRTFMSARVISERKNDYVVVLSNGEEIDIRKGELKCFVGDIIELSEESDYLTIKQITKREKVVEKSSNKTAKSYRYSKSNQVLASNVDQIYIFIAVNQNFSLSKLERYVLVFSQKDIELYLVITKIDLTDNYIQCVKTFKVLYPNINILEISIYNKESLKNFENTLKSKHVGLFIGSSGAGKTTVINHLRQNNQEKVGDVRKDGKGKHTTTMSKMLYCQKYDYYVIDTPGFKAIDKNENLDLSILFSDILTLSDKCRFSDCNHDNTPGCEIELALKDGRISKEKVERYVYNRTKIS
ncbi:MULTISPECIES: ribosome small subunit-dependent GTPase A [Streptococcus]|nr:MULTISPECIES: ribosome small subunit-dependent GTPase A [unclassified Streptococcus]MWV56416.1 ribosome small subunit-dependent GTPase A [Streptococcus sp. zg-70]QTH47376.1 ribosome small subunit-dependent GTPase A [Streptococcus sp. zg-86]